MAETAAVASIVRIATFGIQLTKALYEFGSTVSSATEETSYIARHVDLYANVLDILTERIDDDEPILTDAALDLIEELRYQSNKIFTSIEKLLPTPDVGKEDISFLQKVKWNFTKSKVALLVGELDYLRSTVHLLVTIIFTGKKIHSHRRKTNIATGTVCDDSKEIQIQGVKAQTALLTHHEAQHKLSSLEKEDTQQGSALGIEHSTQRMDVIHTNDTALENLHHSLLVYTDLSERQRVVLQHSAQVLQQLLRQWTTIDQSPDGAISQEQQHTSADGQGPKRSNDARNLNKRVVDSGINVTYPGGVETHNPVQRSESNRKNLWPLPEDRQRAVQIRDALRGQGEERWNPQTGRYDFYNSVGDEFQRVNEAFLDTNYSTAWKSYWNTRLRCFDCFDDRGKLIAVRSQDSLFMVNPSMAPLIKPESKNYAGDYYTPAWTPLGQVVYPYAKTRGAPQSWDRSKYDEARQEAARAFSSR